MTSLCSYFSFFEIAQIYTLFFSRRVSTMSETEILICNLNFCLEICCTENFFSAFLPIFFSVTKVSEFNEYFGKNGIWNCWNWIIMLVTVMMIISYDQTKGTSAPCFSFIIFFLFMPWRDVYLSLEQNIHCSFKNYSKHMNLRKISLKTK